MFHVKHSQPIHSRDLADAGLAVRRDLGEKPIAEWLRYDGVTHEALTPWLGDMAAADPLLAEEMAEDAAYAPYLARQDSELRDLRASEALSLSADFPYAAVPGLSNEMIERLDDSCARNARCGGPGGGGDPGGAIRLARPCAPDCQRAACGMISNEAEARAYVAALTDAEGYGAD